MKIDAFLTPFFPETENQFNDHIVVMIDVFRASTSVCAAIYRGAKEVIPSETTEKAVKIYSSLSREVRFLGGERNGVKPNGFDAGNSPDEYTAEKVADKTVIISTSNGTQIFGKARQAAVRIVGGFVNITAVLDFMNENYLDDEINNENINVTFLCAGTNGRMAYEDTLCAGAYINSLKQSHKEVELTDTADAAKNLYNLHSVDLTNFLMQREHAIFLKSIGFEKDIDTALDFNLFPVVPVISGSSIKTQEKV
ncbi:MAG: 2-phosphosulfolactate phosphatase [Candidatus Kapaibacterium sp.]